MHRAGRDPSGATSASPQRPSALQGKSELLAVAKGSKEAVATTAMATALPLRCTRALRMSHTVARRALMWLASAGFRIFWGEAIGSERRMKVVRITVELVEVTRQHSKMSPTSTLRGLGLGETPLRRWEAVTEMGRSQALIRTIATPSQRQTIDRGTTPRLTSVGYTLVTPTGVAKCALNTRPLYAS